MERGDEDEGCGGELILTYNVEGILTWTYRIDPEMHSDSRKESSLVQRLFIIGFENLFL